MENTFQVKESISSLIFSPEIREKSDVETNKDRIRKS